LREMVENMQVYIASTVVEEIAKSRKPLTVTKSRYLHIKTSWQTRKNTRPIGPEWIRANNKGSYGTGSKISKEIRIPATLCVAFFAKEE